MLRRVIAFIALGAVLVFAEGSTASIIGTVKDVSGAVLQGAVVTVKHLETGLTRTDRTDASGSFTIPSIPVGAYEVTAVKMGFRREVRRGIELVVAQEAVVNLVLQLGNLEQQVTVTEAAPLVNTTLASTSGLISENQIKDMPLNGRSFDQLLTLNTGTTNYTSNVTGGGGGNFFSGSAREFDKTANWRRLERFAFLGFPAPDWDPEAMNLRWPVW